MTNTQSISGIAKYENHALLGLVAVYALSQPWPQSFGLPEAVIMGLLLAFLYRSSISLITFSKSMLSAIFLTLLFVPLLVGLFVQFNEPSDVIRDVIPFLYLCIPLFFFSRTPNPEQITFLLRYLPFYLSFTGVIYALRELYHFHGSLFLMSSTSEHLMQAPVTLFAAIYLLLTGIDFLLNKKLFRSAVLISLALLPASTFYFTILRAPMGLIVLGVAFYFVISARKHLIPILLLAFISLLIFFQTVDINTFFDAFIKKTETHGSNSKIEEFISVINIIFLEENIRTILLGKGWGATWYTQAGVGIVRFAHSLLVYSMLKAGLLGALAILFFYINLAIHTLRTILSRMSMNEWSLLIALGASLFNNLWFEPGYKTLDFGILLLLFYLLSWHVHFRLSANKSTQF